MIREEHNPKSKSSTADVNIYTWLRLRTDYGHIKSGAIINSFWKKCRFSTSEHINNQKVVIDLN